MTDYLRLIQDEIAAVTGLAPANLDTEAPFASLGIESLQAVNILANLSQKTGRELPVTLFFDYPNMRELAAFLAKGLEAGGAAASFAQAREPAAAQGIKMAILGMACRLPGADSPEQFWYNLSFGVDSICETPPDRWDWRKSPDLPQLRWGGFLRDISSFDSELFAIPAPEAEKMDPQQRLLLECMHEAIERSGFSPQDLQRTRTGVFVGISSSDFSVAKARENNSRTDVFDATGNAHSIAANRVSYLFNLRGPSLSIDTACSSSLVALHEACKSLALGECDFALVGGVNVILEPSITRAFAEAGMLAPDGRCKTFSQEANGYVRGEGAGAVLLQRLGDANPARVRAVVAATAVNHEGKTNGLTAPSGPAQEEVIREALGRAKLNPADISFIEAHGTGTALGDPIEFFTLARVFGRKEKKIKVGSAKAFVGHLEAAAGVCGLIKTVLALEHRQWPGQIYYTAINPKMQNAAAEIEVAAKAESMPAGEVVRAGLSSFGFGGTNAHAILETAPPVPPTTPAKRAGADADLLLAFSATSGPALREYAGRFLEELSHDRTDPASLVEAGRRTRLGCGQRLAAWGGSKAEIEQAIASWQAGRPGSWVERRVSRTFRPRVAFAFTGQGSQYSGMGSELAAKDPHFRALWAEALAFLDGYLPHGLRRVCEGGTPEFDKLLYQTDYGQALIFSLEIALARYLEEHYGISPELVFGHSLGEISAAAFSSAIPLSDACRMVAARGSLMQDHTGKGAMVSVRIEPEALRSVLVQHPAVEIGARNGPALYTLSGPPEAIDRALPALEKAGGQAKKLAVERAFHSALMDEMLPQFTRTLEQVRFFTPRMPLISSLTGKFLQDGEFDCEYWRRQARETTQFEAMVKTAVAHGINVIVEIGPHPVLAAMGPACAPGKNVLWLPTLRRGQSSVLTLKTAVAELTLLGARHEKGPLPLALVPPTPFTKTVFARKESPSAPLKEERKIMPSQNEILLTEFRTLVAGLLHMPPEEVDPDMNLIDLGADSLLLLNAIQTIKERHGVSIAVADVFRELNNLRAIANYVHENKAPAAAPASSVPAPAAPAAPAIPAQPAISAPPPPAPLPYHPVNAQVAAEMRLAVNAPMQGGGLKELMDRQLVVMQQQLALLAGSPMAFTTGASAPAQASAPAPLAAQAPQAEPAQSQPPAAASAPIAANTGSLKGVLGNFRSRANREVAADERAKAEYIERFIKRFNEKTRKTKEHTQRYRRYLADNRVSAGFRPNLKEMIYTIIFHEGKGARFFDIDGNDFLDFSMGFGVNLFGHCPDFIEKRIREQIDRGYCVGPQAELAGIVAEKACKVLGHERIAFLNSGTEAVMTALRLARAATGRGKVVIFEGSYHGHSDVVLARQGSAGQSLPVAPGVPSGVVGDVLVLPYGDPSALETIRRHAHELAAVLVEPVQSRYPEHVPVAFLKEIREITARSGTAFIFDEVIFGLRAAPGGAQELFGIKPDLASYGKILGGGMPIGAVAGKSRFLDPIDGGYWQFGDDSYPGAEMTFFAGTFCKHPVAMAACDAVLDRFLTEGHEITAKLNERTTALVKKLNGVLVGTGIEANNFSSLFRFKSQSNLDLFFANLNLRGAYVWEGRNLFTSTAHTDKELDEFVGIVGDSLDELRKEGMIRKKP
jgi:acyl transferase domain-containing protein/glutamate-1-semialdehyde aminotransferase